MAVQTIRASSLPYKTAKRGWDIEIARLRERLNDPQLSPEGRVLIKSKLEALAQKIRGVS